MIFKLKNLWCLLFIVTIIDALQVQYLGAKNGENVKIMENDNITFSCLRDENDMDDMDQISFKYPKQFYGIHSYSYMGNNNNKTFKKINVSHADSGWYGCSDNHGNTKEIFISVESINFNSSSIKTFKMTREIDFHLPVIIPCRPTSYNYDIQLFLDSQEVDINALYGLEFDYHKGFIIRNESYIYDVMEFICSIHMNEKTENIIYRLQIRENYTEVPKININGPVVNVIEGDDVEMNCTIYFNIDETILYMLYWSAHRVKINNTLKHSSTYHITYPLDLRNFKKTIGLILFNVSYVDAGEYICKSEGDNGTISSSVNVTVHGFDAIYINLTTPREFYTCKLNKLVILKVNIESNSKVNTTWYHPDGYEIVPLNSNGKYFINNIDKYLSLLINNVKISDVGNYTLQVKSSLFEKYEKNISIPLVIQGSY